MMGKERDSRKWTRLQMLYLLRTGQATDRSQVARLLGVYRETVGEWLANYEQGGLTKLLEIGQASGAVSSLPAEVIAAMRAKLADPTGVRSFQALRRWVEQTYGLKTTYGIVYYTATQILDGRLAVARRSHTKKKRKTRQPSVPAWNNA
jgi:transposase-like protein